MTNSAKILDDVITKGEMTLNRAKYDADELGLECPVFGYGMAVYWANEVAEYSAAALEDGHKLIYVADKSTALMESLHEWNECGWQVSGFSEVKKDYGFGREESIKMIVLKHA